MKINKELKYATFEYDEETKVFTIFQEDGGNIKLNKVYAFAFMRFVIRMAQRNWLRKAKKHKKEVDIVEEFMVELEESNIDNPNQMLMFESENE